MSPKDELGRAASRGGRSAIKPFDLIIVGSGAAAFGAAIKVNDLRSVHAVAQSTAVVLDTIGAAGQTVAVRPVPHGSALLMNPAHVHLMLNHFSIIGSIFGLVLLAVAMVRNSRELITVSLACLASVAIISVAALLANNRSSFRRVVFTLQHAAAIRDHAYC